MSSLQCLGDQVCELLSSAQREIAIVAPFVTYQAISRLVECCPRGVPVQVAARFLPSDIAAGVCEVAAAEFLLADQRVSNFVRHSALHGKLFRADDRCLVGSANVTNRGLGWAKASNAELLIRIPAGRTTEEFEALIWSSGTRMSEVDLRELVARAREVTLPEHPEQRLDDASSQTRWLPACRNPRVLYDVYASINEWKILESVLESAKGDLRALQPLPDMMDRASFEQVVGHALRRHPVVIWIGETGGATSGEAIQKLADYCSDFTLPFPVEVHWEVLEEWLLYFLGSEMRSIPAETKIVFQRRL